MENLKYDAKSLQKAHSYEKEEVGAYIRMVFPKETLVKVIHVLNTYKGEDDSQEVLRVALLSDYQTILNELETREEQRASIAVSLIDSPILQKAFSDAYKNKRLEEDDWDLVEFMTNQDEILFHLNHNLSDDKYFAEEGDEVYEEETYLEIADEDLPQ